MGTAGVRGRQRLLSLPPTLIARILKKYTLWRMWNEVFNKPKRIIAFIFSGSCVAIVILRVLFPKLLFDQYSLILLGVASLPWLTLFFSKINFPGGGGVETGAQGTAEPKAKPPTSIKIGAIEFELPSISLSPEAKKVLATLWRYQQQSFQNDFSKRWTFLIYPGSPEFIQYMNGVAELLKFRFVEVRSDNSQCMLTNEGIYYAQHHKEIQEYKEFFNF